jgi:Protein of unknown function (DUF2442)
MSALLVNQADPHAVSVRAEEDRFVVELSDGRAVAVPYVWYPRLANATPDQRAQVEIGGRGRGLHWPEIDEDLSVTGLLRPYVNVAPETENTAVVKDASLAGKPNATDIVEDLLNELADQTKQQTLFLEKLKNELGN